jgi:hypothetical protein
VFRVNSAADQKALLHRLNAGCANCRHCRESIDETPEATAAIERMTVELEGLIPLRQRAGRRPSRKPRQDGTNEASVPLHVVHIPREWPPGVVAEVQKLLDIALGSWIMIRDEGPVQVERATARCPSCGWAAEAKPSASLAGLAEHITEMCVRTTS